MSESRPTRPRILCYGMYLNLLESRLLLNAIGCDVDISDQSADVEN